LEDRLGNRALKLSVIVPARNEEGNIPRVYAELSEVRKRLPDYELEFLLIDNASEDKTPELCEEICRRDAQWKYVRFSRNFGSEASIAAGLRYCTGDACIIIFSDLQDPPDKIPEFVAKWREGNDIVFGVYGDSKHEKVLKRWLVARYYALLTLIADIPMIPFAADFRIYDRRVIDVLNGLSERNRYMRGLAQWVGFRTTSIQYHRRPRTAGKSKAPYFYLFGFAFSVIVNFSDKPLRLFTLFGMGVTFISFVMTLMLILNFFINPVLPGLSTTHVLLTFNIAFTALGFGVLGEYVSKIYVESKGRPLFIVDRHIGLEGKIGAGT